MHFQIYVEQGQTLDKVGLSDFTPGENLVQVGQGPANKPGTMFYWPQGGRDEFGYQPERQEWVPAVAKEGQPAERYWVGFWKASPPTPADLKRDKQFTGMDVKLGDGREWLIPAAARLPQVAKYAEDGSIEFKVRREFERFWDESVKYWAQLIAPTIVGDKMVIDVEWIDYVTRALRLNYRITPEVVSHLELIDQQQAQECVLATLSWQESQHIMAILKKKGWDVSILATLLAENGQED